MYCFVPAVVKTVNSIHEVGIIIHRDVCVPNICFDENYAPVLIDLDFSDGLFTTDARRADLSTLILLMMCLTMYAQ